MGSTLTYRCIIIVALGALVTTVSELIQSVTPDFFHYSKGISEPFEKFPINGATFLPKKDLQYHGTTTLALIFNDSVIVAVDSRASIGNYVGSRTVKKIFPISKSMIATMAGGAADCAYWIRRISRQMKILEFEYGSEFSVKATAKFMANTLRDYRGNDISMGTMIAGVDSGGPSIYYVDSQGTCVTGNTFCVGSGSSLAYSILDSTNFTAMTSIDMVAQVAALAVRHAAHRDAFSGGFINVIHINSTGSHHILRIDARNMPVYKDFKYVITPPPRDDVSVSISEDL